MGLDRILKLLSKHSIKSTFFVPGWIIEKYPKEIMNILNDGHELAHHGYIHEYPDTLQEEKEREILERGIEIIQSFSGYKPLGYRSPAWEFSSQTLRLLKEYGFLYSSNMMDDDYPYIHSNGIVELPVQWLLDDAPFFMFHPKMNGRLIQSTKQVFEIWKEEFAALYEENIPTVFTFHPQLIGRAHRIKRLDELIKYIKSHKNTEFTTLAKLAKMDRLH